MKTVARSGVNGPRFVSVRLVRPFARIWGTSVMRDRALVFHGGMHYPGNRHRRASNATWPLAELRFDRDVIIRMRWRPFRFLLSHWLPTITLTPEAVECIERLHLWPTKGFRFWLKQDKPVIFWCLPRDRDEYRPST